MNDQQHPLTDVDDFSRNALLNRAEEYINDGAPMKAAFELGRYAGLLQLAQHRQGDGLPPEDEEAKAEIDCFLEMYKEAASSVEDGAIFEATAVAGMTLAIAQNRLPGPCAHNVHRWAMNERALLVGETEAHRTARDLHSNATPFVPPGFGHPRERTSGEEIAESKAILAGWSEKADGGWIP